MSYDPNDLAARVAALEGAYGQPAGDDDAALFEQIQNAVGPGDDNHYAGERRQDELALMQELAERVHGGEASPHEMLSAAGLAAYQQTLEAAGVDTSGGSEWEAERTAEVAQQLLQQTIGDWQQLEPTVGQILEAHDIDLERFAGDPVGLAGALGELAGLVRQGQFAQQSHAAMKQQAQTMTGGGSGPRSRSGDDNADYWARVRAAGQSGYSSR